MAKWSTGCDRCRQKKVKCDASRPTCKRCLRAGSQCPGYNRTPFEIKDETARTVQKVMRGAPIARDSSVSVFGPVSRDMSEYSGSMWPVELGHINRILFSQHVLDIYMPEEPPITTANRFSYIPTIAAIQCINPAVIAARDAFSVAQLGTSHKDPLLLAHARQLYGDALHQIRVALENKTARSRQETLVAITLAGLCEFFTAVSCDGLGWNTHVVGASQLLASWGTFPVDSPLARLIFDNLRNSIVIKGLITRRAVLFDQPAWLEQISSSSNSEIASTLNDIMVHIPALLQHSDRCMLEDNEKAIAETLHGSWSLKRRLKTWYNRLQRNADHNTFQEVSVTTLPRFCAAVGSRVFPMILSFASFHTGYQHLMYWLSNFILGDNDLRLIDRYTPSAGLGSKFKRSQLEQERLNHANLICQGIPYCTELPEASIGRIGVLCPLLFCQEFFRIEGFTAQLSWCKEVHAMITRAGLCPPSLPMPQTWIGFVCNTRNA